MASVGAIVSIRRRTCCIDGVSPIKSGRPLGGLEPGLERGRLVGHVAPLGDPVQDHLELGPLARLGQVVEGAEPQRLHGGVDRGVAGQDDRPGSRG